MVINITLTILGFFAKEYVSECVESVTDCCMLSENPTLNIREIFWRQNRSQERQSLNYLLSRHVLDSLNVQTTKLTMSITQYVTAYKRIQDVSSAWHSYYRCNNGTGTKYLTQCMYNLFEHFFQARQTYTSQLQYQHCIKFQWSSFYTNKSSVSSWLQEWLIKLNFLIAI